MVRNEFDGAIYDTYSELLKAVEQWQYRAAITPMMNVLDPLVSSFQREFQEISRTFLDADPVPIKSSIGAPFTSQSDKRDVRAAARRFALGVQPRGVHVSLRSATTMLGHLAIAKAARHPSQLLFQVLDPSWEHVFAQFDEAFHRFGAQETWRRVVVHRDAMMAWVRRVALTLEPVRQQFRSYMPQPAAVVASHIHVPLFYVLLKCVGYKNPELAFRFFVGAPLIGTFTSPALPMRVKEGEPISDPAIRDIAQTCRGQCARLVPKLSDAAAEKSMEKMDKEFASESLVGPFSTFDQLCDAMEAEMRTIHGLENFVLDRSLVIASPQFSVEEQERVLNSQEHEDAIISAIAEQCHISEVKVRNIWNGKTENKLAGYTNTYIPNNHADLAAIILRWLSLFMTFAPVFNMLAWPSDFTGAYRQMPIFGMHIPMGASCHWNYRRLPPRKEYAFYRSLPFGSSLAPAGWSEVTFALCFLMAFAFLAVLTHCVDDVCCVEVEEIVFSSRAIFVELCELIGLRLDMDKTLTPCSQLIYLGLNMILPARLPSEIREFSLSVPPKRLLRLIAHMDAILRDQTLTPAQASSHRGRLFFYTFWAPEARGFLAEFAARQYSSSYDYSLTEDLLGAVRYFRELLNDPQFLAGVRPADLLNRRVVLVYTDGALEGADTPRIIKGVGGVLFDLPFQTPLYFSEPDLARELPHLQKIAPIEMHGIFRALELFGSRIRGTAVLFFVDNTHALGCLLKGSAAIAEESRKRPLSSYQYSHYSHFLSLPLDIRRQMNFQARAIWRLIAYYDLVVWFEYVHTDCNIADPPSRGLPVPCQGARDIKTFSPHSQDAMQYTSGIDAFTTQMQ